MITHGEPDVIPVELEAANTAPKDRKYTGTAPVKPENNTVNNSSLTKNVNTLNFVNIKIEAARDEVTALINKLHDLTNSDTDLFRSHMSGLVKT